MSADETYLLTRPPIVAQRPRVADPLVLLREYAHTVPAMGPADLATALRGDAPLMILERCARADGARLGVS